MKTAEKVLRPTFRCAQHPKAGRNTQQSATKTNAQKPFGYKIKRTKMGHILTRQKNKTMDCVEELTRFLPKYNLNIQASTK